MVGQTGGVATAAIHSSQLFASNAEYLQTLFSGRACRARRIFKLSPDAILRACRAHAPTMRHLGRYMCTKACPVSMTLGLPTNEI